MENSNKPHVLLLASPGIGHFIPVLQLAKRLVSFDTLHVTLFYVSTESSSTAQSELISWSSKFHQNLQIIDLTPPNVWDSVPTHLAVEIQIGMMMQQSMSPLASRITSMNPRPCAIIVDLFGFQAFSVADQFGVPKYVFVTSNAWFLAYMVYTPTMDQQIEGQYVDRTEPIPIPGCKPIPIPDLVDAMLDRDLERYNLHLDWCQGFTMPDGLLVNTWQELEPQPLSALGQDSVLAKIIKAAPVYPIGPIVRTDLEMTCNDECLDWLSRQPLESVLYVSFGSGGTQSHRQITELAWGLLMSQQRFIWVVRPPSETDASGSYFNSANKSLDPSQYLPDGFLTQINGLGMVVPNWGPQQHILAHPAIGGFLSHCGWNSSLESVINAVPIIAWPLYAEQKMNATMLAEDLGIAIKVDLAASSEGVVSRVEIDKIVRLVMVSKQGKWMRDNVRELKKSAQRAIDKDGSSYNTMLEVIREMSTNTK